MRHEAARGTRGAPPRGPWSRLAAPGRQASSDLVDFARVEHEDRRGLIAGGHGAGEVHHLVGRVAGHLETPAAAVLARGDHLAVDHDGAPLATGRARGLYEAEPGGYITNRLLNRRVIHAMKTDQLDATFGALADPTRRAILARLARGEATVAELAKPFDISQPAISKHLKVLERAGLISRGRDAQSRPCRLEGRRLREATEWMNRYRAHWEASFDRLDGVLDEMKKEETRRGRTK
ncbi:MAG: metalloregulator ArsR/SmtB family transcription factor [Polyangiales bacterium]